MNDDRRNDALGRNITAYAAPKERRGTISFAVEIPLDDFAAVEQIADARGVNVSGVILETARHQQAAPPQRTCLVPAQGRSVSGHVDYQPNNTRFRFEQSRASESRFELQPGM